MLCCVVWLIDASGLGGGGDPGDYFSGVDESLAWKSGTGKVGLALEV
jgi:hypothetical protein